MGRPKIPDAKYRCRPCRKNHTPTCSRKVKDVGGCKIDHGRAEGCLGKNYRRFGCQTEAVSDGS